MPNRYESYLRIAAPTGGAEDWWSVYRELFQTVASIGEQHTRTPEEAWFAIWEGHGFPAIAEIPLFELPQRTYYLLNGPVMAATEARYPDFQGWHNPDLIWPDDRSWFIATDVDFWSLYAGGTHEFAAELARSFGSNAIVASLDDKLVTEA